MSEATLDPAVSLPQQKKLSLKVFGVGGAGGNAVSSMAQGGFSGVSFVGLNTDVQALQQTGLPDQLVLGQNTTRGLGAGGDPEQGRAAAEENVAQLKGLCEGTDLVFIVAGLGGGTGTGASPVLARVAKAGGALVLGIVTLPFEFEGGRRQRQALLGLQQLKAEADGVICLPNQKLFKLVDERTSVLAAFQYANALLAQAVGGIWRLLSRPGLINLDFADLCTATRGKHTESLLAAAEAAGEHRAQEVLAKLQAHPLLDGGQVLSHTDALLVSFLGGPDLTMAEVNQIMEQLRRQAEEADILLGAAIDEAYAGRLAVTLLASGAAPREPERPVANGGGPKTVEAPPPQSASELDTQFLSPALSPARSAPRYLPPPPTVTPERIARLYKQQGGGSARHRKRAAQALQGQLPLEIISRGRFEQSEPTVHQGEDLDIPTYIRRGVPLN